MIRYTGENNLRLNAAWAVAALALTLPMMLCKAATIQVGFSPEGTARTLVLSVIESAKHNIRMLGYDFTAPDIARALIEAKKRGVDVRLVLDESGNRGRASRAAMDLVANEGVQVRIDSHYKIQHDKVIVIDSETVETGSFNYTASAERYNSENAIVIWNYPQIAAPYLDHWRTRWEQSTPYKSSY